MNAVAPGLVETPWTAGWEANEAIVARTPLWSGRDARGHRGCCRFTRSHAVCDRPDRCCRRRADSHLTGRGRLSGSSSRLPDGTTKLGGSALRLVAALVGRGERGCVCPPLHPDERLDEAELRRNAVADHPFFLSVVTVPGRLNVSGFRRRVCIAKSLYASVGIRSWVT
jgi:hypothetical protein